MAQLTLGDLLDLDLGLTLVSGEADARRRPVLGAHSSELERPAAWIERDWILLTTGVRLRRRADAQRALVAELATAGAAAIGFGVGIAYERAPAALLDAARKHGLPVFTVALATPFSAIVRTVHRAQSGSDAVDLQRLSAMQLQLLDGLGEPAPRQAVIDRLAELLSATVLLLSPSGTLLARSGRATADGVWEALTGRDAPLVEVALEGRHVVAAPVAAPGRPAGRLAVVSRRPHPAGRLTRPAVRASARILAALAHVDEAALRQERAIRQALLGELLAPPADASATALAGRSAAFGVPLDGGAAVVLLERRKGDAERLLEAWEEHASATALRQLAAVCGSGGAVAALVRDPGGANRAALEAFAAGAGALAGVGRPASAPAEVPRSLREARLALGAARQRAGEQPGARVAAFGELDLATFLAGSAPRADVAPLAGALLAPLRREPHLDATLRAWLAHDCDAVRTAAALGLRANSLRYRLARVERLLGQPLRRPRTIASLWLALALEAADEPAAA